jgi:pyruvate dehydrogenase E2 component (dihydrolipoamide acetyltransferase)
MPVQILMPALSPTMTEGNLVKWLKAEGEIVKPGEVIAEIETDKATMEVEAVDEGILAKIIIPAGTESVKVNSLIALLLEDGEDAAALDTVASMPQASIPEATTTAATASVTPPAKPKPSTGERQFSSPLARRIAEQNQIDLQVISGSGPHGRVIKSDVEAVIASGKSGQRLGVSPAPIQYNQAGYVDAPLNNMRKVIAKRLTESKQEVPHFYLTVDCHLDALLKLRSEVNNRLDNQKISVNDFIVRACDLALTRVPEANVAWFETFLRQYQAADVSVAVAIDGGLVTPVIRSAQEKSLREISQEVKSLAERARAGKLAPEDYQGGTFTISNLGMYGIKQFAAILNPPQACILAVGAGEQRAIIKEGQISIATVMTCTLSVDHRAVDGAIGSKFLASFKELIEDPLQLII